MEVVAYIALGTNLGDRAEQLREAVRLLREQPNLTVQHLSSVYETDPVGFVEQPAFLNMVVKITTSLSPQELLAVMQLVEKNMGRIRIERWGPRVIDLDLILYGDTEIESDELQVPHPEYTKRAFVLYPLLDVWGEGQLPFENKTIREILQQQEVDGGVNVWGMLE